MQTYLIYGANGYTGELIARAARARGHAPILAGRRESTVRPLAEELGLAYRAFSLADPSAVDAGLDGIPLLLNCAGPFSQTARPLVDGCLRRHVHYLDVTGEVDVFEALAARDQEARAASVMLLPGVGFDVVPTDCVAAHLHRRLPGATQLRLAIQLEMALSRGTATTTVEGFGRPNLVRRGGVITPLPMGELAREIDFGAGPVLTVAIPWGDVSTAYHSTGIPDIEVYTAANALVRMGMRLSNLIAPLLRSSQLQGFLKRQIQKNSAGPTLEERTSRRSRIWGEAIDDAGTRAITHLETPEAYNLTIETALAAITLSLTHPPKLGFQTPSRAFGPDFILQIPTVTRRDL
ncbi:MAG: saccharopine dehydrogenase NADP-binding domain-containing protein [Polyangiales bacterium]